MDVPVIEYLRWARSPRDVDYDLSRSGLDEVPLETLGLGRKDLLLHEGNDWGGPSLRAAIADSFAMDEKNVLPVHGTTFGVFLACAALLDPGDHVLVECPAYEPLRRIPLLFGAKVDRLPRPFQDSYRFDRDQMERMIRKDTKLIVLSDPHNPSGVCLSEEERGWLGALGEERNVDILVDEVYIDFKKPQRADDFPHAFSHGPRMISVASLTKVYGFPRLRVGWMIAREEFIRRTAPLYDYTVGDPSGPSAALGVAALARRRELREAAVRKAEENGRHVRAWMEERDDLEWIPPDAGIIAFPRFRRETDSDRFVSFAREKHRVLPAPGGYFEDTRGFRLGFGIDRSLLPEALGRLGTALSEWA